MGTDLPGSRRVQPGPLRRPDQPRRRGHRRSSWACSWAASIGGLAGGVRRQGRLGPDARRRRPARDPGHPAGDRRSSPGSTAGLPQIMFAVAMTNAPIFARILRGSLLALRESDYVIAARSIGARDRRGSWCATCCPNALTPLIVAATLALATAIIDVAGLGFLGLGPPDPRTAGVGDDADRRDEVPPPGAVADLLPGARDRRSARSASTCSATGSASRSTRG